MRKLIWIQLVMIVLGGLVIAYFGGYGRSASFLSGALIVEVNLVLHILVWGFFVRKKLIAFAATVIVFKYGILAAIIYKILQMDWSDPIWFCVGVSTLVLSAVVFGISRKEDVI